MNSGNEIKSENLQAFSICFACLSTDRKLYSLGDYSSLFFKLFDEHFMMRQTTFPLCWECKAFLKKLKVFKEKVDHAQLQLSSHYHSQMDTTPKSLSTLMATTITNLETRVKAKEIVETPKPEVIVKVESQDDETRLGIDNDNYESELFDCEPNDYVNLEDIKTEDTKLILKIKNFKSLLEKSNVREEKIRRSQKKRDKQKRRYIRIGLEKKAISRSVSVCYSEVERWMEKDRQSEFFRSLKHKCSHCVVRMFSTNKRSHWREFHDVSSNRKYTCAICSCTFKTKKVLSNHMKSHSLLKECQLCGFRCYCRDYMKHHLVQHSKSVQCRQCALVLPTVADFTRHYRELHREYRCEHCPKHCFSRRVMEKHMIRNHLPIECKECNVKFKHYNTYKGHVNLKHVKLMTEEAFCVPCNRQFANPLEYKNHVNSAVAHRNERKHANVKREKVPCPECPKTYMKRHSMLNHWRYVHQKESKYRCEHCGVQLLNRTKLVEHVKFKHEGAVREKNQLCTICGRGFATRRILRHHVRTHTGERPYHCMYCGARFAQQYAMQSHVKFVHLKARRRPAYGEFAEYTEGH